MLPCTGNLKSRAAKTWDKDDMSLPFWWPPNPSAEQIKGENFDYRPHLSMNYLDPELAFGGSTEWTRLWRLWQTNLENRRKDALVSIGNRQHTLID